MSMHMISGTCRTHWWKWVNSNDQVFASSWTGSPGGSSSSSSSSDSSGSQPTTSAGQQSGSSGSSSGQQASSSTSQQQTRSPPEGQEDEGTPATRSEPLFSLRIVVSLAAVVLFMFSSYEWTMLHSYWKNTNFPWNALIETIQAAKAGLRVCWPWLRLISAVWGFWTTTIED